MPHSRAWHGRRSLLVAGAGLALLRLSGVQAAERGAVPGVTATEIRIGGILPYSGPASAYGVIGKAKAAYFQYLNDHGGINGRQVRFISLDDGYSPPRAVEQARRLVEQDEVLLVFGPLGTASNTAIRPYLNRRKVPQLFVATGAAKWNDPAHFPWTMGWQPSYVSEARHYARRIVASQPDARIGVLYQNDDFGKDFLLGLEAELGERYRTMVASALSYEVTDPTVDSQLVTLKGSGADVFLNLSTPKFAAQAIRKAAAIGWKPVQYLASVSMSVGGVLEPAGLENAQGIHSAFYLKDPVDPQWRDDPGFLQWSAWMDHYLPEADKADGLYVYGYSAAQSLVKVLEACGDDLGRENVMRQAAHMDHTLPMLLPGIRVRTSPDDFEPIRTVYLGRFEGTSWKMLGPL